jgi:hypothetical protein
MVNFPFIYSNIPAAPAYGIDILPELMVHIMISLIEDFCNQGSY